jgi:NADH dehydrogenase (ubiquinone) Fe-S protein 6
MRTGATLTDAGYIADHQLTGCLLRAIPDNTHPLHCKPLYATPMSLVRPLLPRLSRPALTRSYARPPSAAVPNTPQPPKPLPSQQPTASTSPSEYQQSPNVPSTWSTTQQPKPAAYSDPRFEQTDFSLQPNSLSAMGMVAQDPVRMVTGRKAVCDGGELEVL